MQKRSEVCKNFGVSRGALQRYNKEGILKPSYINSSGYWFYDDEAIQRLQMIMVFQEAGCNTYDQIKEMLKEFDDNPDAIFDRTLTLLNEKRKRIDGLISIVHSCKQSTQLMDNLSEHTLGALESIDSQAFSKAFFNEKSFSQYLNDAIQEHGDDPMSERDISICFQIVQILLEIGSRRGNHEDSESVQTSIKEGINQLLISFEIEPDSLDELWFVAEMCSDTISMILDEQECKSYCEELYGKGTTEYIKRALDKYSNNRIVELFLLLKDCEELRSIRQSFSDEDLAVLSKNKPITKNQGTHSDEPAKPNN